MPDGLFQLGHSKGHRPDLPQLKVQLSVLDPLGLPLSNTIVEGARADDRLYVPEIKKVSRIYWVGMVCSPSEIAKWQHWPREPT
jgi:transposase